MPVWSLACRLRESWSRGCSVCFSSHFDLRNLVSSHLLSETLDFSQRRKWGLYSTRAHHDKNWIVKPIEMYDAQEHTWMRFMMFQDSFKYAQSQDQRKLPERKHNRLGYKVWVFFSCFVDDVYLLFYYGHRLKGDKMFTLRGLIFTRMLYTYTEIFLFIVLNVLTSNKDTIY